MLLSRIWIISRAINDTYGHFAGDVALQESRAANAGFGPERTTRSGGTAGKSF